MVTIFYIFNLYFTIMKREIGVIKMKLSKHKKESIKSTLPVVVPIVVCVYIAWCSAMFIGGCSSSSYVQVNVSNTESIHNNLFGKDTLIEIGNGLYYDSTTRIVYWWNGILVDFNECSNTPTAYYAPNGLPYKYNPETNTFEEIDLMGDYDEKEDLSKGKEEN